MVEKLIFSWSCGVTRWNCHLVSSSGLLQHYRQIDMSKSYVVPIIACVFLYSSCLYLLLAQACLKLLGKNMVTKNHKRSTDTLFMRVGLHQLLKKTTEEGAPPRACAPVHGRFRSNSEFKTDAVDQDWDVSHQDDQGLCSVLPMLHHSSPSSSFPPGDSNGSMTCLPVHQE